jgi:hypothetical protein
LAKIKRIVCEGITGDISLLELLQVRKDRMAPTAKEDLEEFLDTKKQLESNIGKEMLQR